MLFPPPPPPEIVADPAPLADTYCNHRQMYESQDNIGKLTFVVRWVVTLLQTASAFVIVCITVKDHCDTFLKLSLAVYAVTMATALILFPRYFCLKPSSVQSDEQNTTSGQTPTATISARINVLIGIPFIYATIVLFSSFQADSTSELLECKQNSPVLYYSTWVFVLQVPRSFSLGNGVSVQSVNHSFDRLSLSAGFVCADAGLSEPEYDEG